MHMKAKDLVNDGILRFGATSLRMTLIRACGYHTFACLK